MKYSALLISAVFLLTFSAHAADAPPPPLKGEAEAGAIVTSGSSDSESYAAKLKTSYTQDKNVYTLFGHYIKAEANSVESARNWDIGVRYDRELSNLWSVFIGQKTESDIFAGYLQRDSTDIGAKYNIIKTDDLNWFAELGYRYSKTQPADNSGVTYDSFGRAYTEVNKSWDKTLSFKYWAEYLPNFTNADGYLFNTEASINIMLNSVFSLRYAYLLQYQNQPPDSGKHSTTTSTMNLVAKF